MKKWVPLLLVAIIFVTIDIILPHFYRVAVAEGQSMYPVITPDDLVIVQLGNKGISKGDIIIFKQNEKMIIHRVIQINETTIITQGDNCDRPDSPVSRENVLGKVVLIIPKTGKLLKLIIYYWQVGFLFLFVCFLIIAILMNRIYSKNY